DAAGQRPLPRAEGVIVSGLDEEHPDALADVGLRTEDDLAALAERHGSQIVAEAHGADLRGHAVDPDRALAVLGRVEEPGDGVPRHPAAVLIEAGARGPAPALLPRMIAGVDVDEQGA